MSDPVVRPPWRSALWSLAMRAGLATVLVGVATPAAHAVDPTEALHPGKDDDDTVKKGRGAAGTAKKGGRDHPHAKKGKHKKKKKGPALVGPFKKKEYPVPERLRPLVLPNQMFEVGLDAGYAHQAGEPLRGGPPLSQGVVGLDLSYGIADRFEVGAGTDLMVAPQLAWNGTVTPYGRWLAVDGKKLDFAPALYVPIRLEQTAPTGAVVDLTTRYLVNDTVFLTFGQNAVPITLSPELSVAVQANGGIGWQLDRAWVATVDTTLATLTLAPEPGVTGPWQTVSINGAVQYSPTRYWDVGVRAGFGDDLTTKDSSRVSVAGFGRVRF